jgi:hypothetical protein
MTEREVLNLLLARRDNYDITEIRHVFGRAYSLVMNNRELIALVLPRAFDFYEMRYHLCKELPDMVICHQQDTVLAMACIDLKSGRIAEPYALPNKIRNVEEQRHRSKTGSQCLLGMLMCGVKMAHSILDRLPATTAKRYRARAKALSKRRPGKPVVIASQH